MYAQEISANALESRMHIQYPEIAVDGPVGAPSQEYHNYRVAVLIGAGIGVTPFASILKSMIHLWEEHRCPKCGVVKIPKSILLTKIYFYWVTKEQEQLGWFSTTMNHLAEMDTDNRLEIHNYLTPLNRDSVVAPLQFVQSFMHENVGRDVISGLHTKNLTHFGRPDWKEELHQIAKKHPSEQIGVFLCGPPQLGNDVHSQCAQFNFNSKYGVKYSYHSERF